MKNKQIRLAMLENNMKQWQVAKLLGYSEPKFSQILRDELPEEEQKRIVALIEGAEGGIK